MLSQSFYCLKHTNKATTYSITNDTVSDKNEKLFCRNGPTSIKTSSLLLSSPDYKPCQKGTM